MYVKRSGVEQQIKTSEQASERRLKSVWLADVKVPIKQKQ